MKPKAERFADTRTDRYRYEPYARTLGARRARQLNSKQHAELFRAVRLDKRFAVPQLSATGNALLHTVVTINSTRFAKDSCIPPLLYYSCAAHRSLTDPTKVACYPTLADARRGREVVMSAGRFFAQSNPSLSPAQVQTLAETFIEHVRPTQVLYATDPDEWVSVYNSSRGFKSCMIGFDADEYNPVRFYAHPDNPLRLAYLAKDGETTARSIVNDDNQSYVRVYGDARLAKALEAAGYTHSANLALNRVKCVAKTNQHGDLIAPYLDGVSRIAWDGESDTCRIDENGDYEADSTDGIAPYEDNRSCCEVCDNRTNDDELNYSDYHDLNICDDCAQRRYTYAIYSRGSDTTLVSDDDVIEVAGTSYLNDSNVLDAHGLVCVDDEWYSEDDVVYLEYLGEYALLDDCVRLDVPTTEGDNYAHDNDIKTITLDGETLTVHEDYEGPTDEVYKTARAESRKAVRPRLFSRGPGRRSNRSLQRRRQAAYRSFLEESL